MTEIVGPNLTLRTFTAAQITDRYLAWLSDPEVNQYSRRAGRAPVLTAEAESYLRSLGEEEEVLAMHVADFGHVGNIKYGPIDRANLRADISILVGEKSVWGRGLGAEAVYLVTRHLFRNLGLHRVDAGSRNPAFLAMVAKLGWKTEGVLRQRVRSAEGFQDMTVVAQLASEFITRPEYERAN